MLKDLNQLVTQAKAERAKYKEQEFILPADFKQEYLKLFPNTQFQKYSVTETKTGGLKVFFPNQWFILALFSVKYLSNLFQYKDIIKDQLSFDDEMIKDFKNSRSINQFVKDSILSAGFSLQDQEYLKLFLSDYSWWEGSKTIDRGDFYISPVLNLAGVVHVTSNHIADLAVRLTNNPYLSQILNKFYKQQNFKSDLTPLSSEQLAFNNILYGPPGTGKTYHTKCKAVSIIDNQNYTINDFDQYNPIYEQKVSEGDIIFTTFHQGMSYEEFIEGIKPKVTTSGNVTYEIQDGIFKQAAKQALVKSLSKIDNEENLKKKDYSELLSLYQKTPKESLSDAKVVLIIDEINRGNVSAIFGELITLIEDSKRLGQTDQISAKLTYSKTEFIVPNNLFIIGTMNTADRSVEALDTALRRRFTFEQMLPNESLLSKINEAEDSEIDLQLLLSSINKRIQKLINKDHQIGHAYLINVDTLDSLNSVFKTKIIPLLEEYFYGDYVKIGRILGPNFVITNNFEEIEFLAVDDDEFTYTDKKHFIIDPAKEKFSVEDFQSIYRN